MAQFNKEKPKMPALIVAALMQHYNPWLIREMLEAAGFDTDSLTIEIHDTESELEDPFEVFQ